MPVFELQANGKTYEVDAPDMQSAASAFTPQPQQKPQAKPNSLLDAVRSAPGGIAKGFAAIAGLPGDIAAFGRNAGRAPEPEPTTLLGKIERMTRLPTSGGISNAIGGYYEPQTPAGRITENIASFAPAALMPGSLPMRAARMLVPGATSELAGQATAGTSAEPYARIGGALIGTGGLAAGPAIARTGARVANRAVNAVSGREFLDPEAIARERLQASIGREGGVPALQQNVNDWGASGASNPSLIDVTGNNTRRLVRAAASGSTGDAQNIAGRYADEIAGNIQDRSSGLVRGLTPGRQNTAEATAQGLEDARRQAAQVDYAPAYEAPIDVTPEMVSALSGSEGRAAIGRALRAASSRRNVKQIEELQSLLSVVSAPTSGVGAHIGRTHLIENALKDISAGSVDRVRIAMGRTGEALNQNPATRDIAGGYFDRTRDIDTALEQAPNLQPARAAYRNSSQQIEAVGTGQGAMTAPSAEYVPAVNAMTPQARAAAQIGHRQALLDAIERPAQGSTGTLNRIATSQQQGENLGATFGQPAADRLRAGIGNEIGRLRNARFVSPNTGSQTALRADELGLVDAIPTSRLGILSHAVTALRNGLTLTDAQRAAIVRLGTSERDLRSFMRAMPRQQPNRIAAQVLLSTQGAQARRAQ